MDASDKKTKLLSPGGGSSSAKNIRITANFRTGGLALNLLIYFSIGWRIYCVGYLFKKTRDGKWQKRWFETNGCFLTYYKVWHALVFLEIKSGVIKQGQKLLAALNLPQVGTITLLGEDSSDGPGLFTIELNERVYTIKARSHEEAAFWVDALLWRQAGGVVTQKSPAEMNKAMTAAAAAEENPDKRSSSVTKAGPPINPDEFEEPLPQEQVKGCAPCCTIQ